MCVVRETCMSVVVSERCMRVRKCVRVRECESVSERVRE